MRFKNYEEYSEERNRLIDEAEKVLDQYDENKPITAEDNKKVQNLIEKIKVIDKENIDLKDEKNAVELANERALKGGSKVTDIYSLGVDVNGTIIESTVMDTSITNSLNTYKRGDKKMPNLFLNKTDKLTDRVDKSNDKTNELLNQEGALGEVIKGIVTGKWNNIELKNAVTTTSSGVLIPEVLSANIIDLSRDMSLFTSAGVRVVPMDTNNMTISRVTTDPKFSFKAEGELATESSFELDSVELNAKTAYGYAYVTLESIKSSQNLDAIIRQVFAQAMANTIDKGYLYGQEKADNSGFETFAPSGIMNDSNINSVVATAGGGYDDFIKAIGKVRQANGNPTAYGINAETEELLSLLKTSDKQYLTAPTSVTDLQRIVSNQLNYDATAGSDALVFDPMAMLIGIQNNIQIKIIEDTECLKKGLVGFQIYSMLDCKAITPKHICKITGIK